MAVKQKNVNEKQPGWLNKSEMANSLGISTQAFDKWGVKPVLKLGREAFFTAADVVENRIANAEEKSQRKQQVPAATEIDLIADPVERLKAQKLEQEIITATLKNSVLEGRSLPAEAVTEVLSRILGAAINVFETMPLDISRRFPDLDPRILREIEKRLAGIRNEAATLPERLDEIIDDIVAEAEDRIT